MANWYDDFLDGASDLASKASFNNVFGEMDDEEFEPAGWRTQDGGSALRQMAHLILVI